MNDNALHRTGQRELQPINNESTDMTATKPTITPCSQKFCRVETNKGGQQVLFLIESDETGVPQMMGITAFMIDQGGMKAPLIFKGPLGDMSSEQMDAIVSGELSEENLAEMVDTAIEELHAMVNEMVEGGLTFTPPEHVHGEHCNHGHDHSHEHQHHEGCGHDHGVAQQDGEPATAIDGAAEAKAEAAAVASSLAALPDGGCAAQAEEPKKEGGCGNCATCSCN